MLSCMLQMASVIIGYSPLSVLNQFFIKSLFLIVQCNVLLASIFLSCCLKLQLSLWVERSTCRRIWFIFPFLWGFQLLLLTISSSRVLLVFGGVSGVDAALEAEEALAESRAEEAFDRLVNSLPSKGTNSERVEENVFITLAEVTMRLQQLCSRWSPHLVVFPFSTIFHLELAIPKRSISNLWAM